MVVNRGDRDAAALAPEFREIWSKNLYIGERKALTLTVMAKEAG
jgi:hypothetical protein